MRVEIRSALEWDAEGIDAIVKGCADETALLISPAGSKGYAAFLRADIRLGRSNSQFVVAESGEELVGVAEFRRMPNRIFVNHIYVRPEARRQGIGSRLLAAGLAGLDDQFSEIALDVDSNNEVARRWYASLGLVEVEEAVWSIVESSCLDGAIGWWRLGNAVLASISLERFGFCVYEVVTYNGEWRLGYTGRAARILDATAVKETGVLAAVRTLAPDRPLVFRGEASLVPSASELGKRLRMEGKIAAVARKVGVVR